MDFVDVCMLRLKLLVLVLVFCVTWVEVGTVSKCACCRLDLTHLLLQGAVVVPRSAVDSMETSVV